MSKLTYPSQRRSVSRIIRLGIDRSKARGCVLAALVCLLVWSTGMAMIAPDQLDEGYMQQAIILGAVIFFLQCAYLATGPRPLNWISIDIFFMLGFASVHFTYAAYWLLGALPPGQLLWVVKRHHYDTPSHFEDWSHVVPFATMMSVAAFAAFAVGFNLLKDRLPRPLPSPPANARIYQQWKTIASVTLAVGCICGFATVMAAGPEAIFGGGYKGSEGLSYWTKIVFLLAMMLMQAGAGVYFIAFTKLNGKWPFLSLSTLMVLIYLATLILQGDRSAAGVVLLLSIAAYSEFVKPVSLGKLAAIIIAGSFGLALFGVGRNAINRDPLSFISKMIDSFGETRIDAGLLTASGSMQTLYAAVEHIPSRHDYYHGQLQRLVVPSLVPFGIQIYGFLFDLSDIDIRETSSANLLSWRLIQEDLYRGMGKGTTCVADVYCDFGLPGVLITMFAIGLLCKVVQQKARSSPGVIWPFVYCSLFSVVTLMNRDAVFPYLHKHVLWPLYVVLLMRVIAGISRARPVGHQQQAAHQLGLARRS